MKPASIATRFWENADRQRPFGKSRQERPIEAKEEAVLYRRELRRTRFDIHIDGLSDGAEIPLKEADLKRDTEGDFGVDGINVNENWDGIGSGIWV